MATITVTRTGRRWVILPSYSVIIQDSTGKIGFHGNGRKGARLLAAALRPIVGNRPVGPMATIIAEELLTYTPGAGEEWGVNA
jgi:hypothetical protein